MAVDPRSLVIHLQTPYRNYEPVVAPAREIILAGLSWPTEYWVTLAIGWLEEGASVDREIAALLDSVGGDRHFPQSLRHRAFRLARQWERRKQDIT